MKNLKIYLLLGLSFILATTLHAQYYGNPSKVIKKSGDINFLKGQKAINIEYDYSDFSVGAFDTEEEYTSKKVEEYNKKEPGKGDKWFEGWVGARKQRYEPKFEALFNKVLKAKTGVYVEQNKTEAKYTLIVKTTFIEPGMNIGIAKKPAYCDFDFIFIETGNPDNVIALLYIKNVIGSQSMGYDFDVGSRIAESYAKGAKMFAGYLYKEVLKEKK
ncbi:MAG: hypothetical protein ABII90_13440 [Bacteroidota bacterium]